MYQDCFVVAKPNRHFFQNKSRMSMKNAILIFNALHKLARPYLTVMIATTFNLVCAWAAITGRITVIEYVTAVSPTNSMIIGFWFGERAALKVPGKSEEEDK
jgi:hypothetical protein